MVVAGFATTYNTSWYGRVRVLLIVGGDMIRTRSVACPGVRVTMSGAYIIRVVKCDIPLRCPFPPLRATKRTQHKAAKKRQATKESARISIRIQQVSHGESPRQRSGRNKSQRSLRPYGQFVATVFVEVLLPSIGEGIYIVVYSSYSMYSHGIL